MDIGFAFLGLLSVLVVLGLPIALVVLVVQRLGRDDEEGEAPDPGIGTVRRLFLYGLAAVALAIAASGLALLLGGVIEALFGDTVVADSDDELAVALSLTVVGLPAWLVFAGLAFRSLRTHSVEARTTARWVYLAGVRGVALVVGALFAVEVGQALAGADPFDGTDWGWFLVTAAVWAGHELEARRVPPAPGRLRSSRSESLDRIYRAFGTGFGLALLGFGLVMLLTDALLAVYDETFRAAIVGTETRAIGVREGIAQVVVVAAVWAWCWLSRGSAARALRREEETDAWNVVVFLFGILAGLAVAVTSAAVVLYLALEWALDAPEVDDVSAHFADAVRAFGVFLVGLASLVYHRLVVGERAAARATGAEPESARRSDPERVYRYLAAAAGLLTLGGGITSGIALALDALLPADAVIRDPEWWRADLATTLTLLLVGAPLWARHWFASQHVASQHGAQRSEIAGAEERDSLPRRAFLFAIFGSAIVVALVTLAILLYELFNGLLEGTLAASTVRDSRWSAGLLASAAVIAVYYWLVLRDDQAAERAPRLHAESGPAARHPLPNPLPQGGEGVSDLTPSPTASQTAGGLERGSAAPVAHPQPVEGSAHPEPPEGEVLLIAPPESIPTLRDALEARGVRVHTWALAADGTAPPLDAEAVLTRLEGIEGTSAVVLVEGEEVRVLPAAPAPE